MKKYIYIFVAIFACIMFNSCDTYFVDRDGTHIEKGIKQAVTEHLECNLLVPSSLSIESICYAQSESIYEADAQYRALKSVLDVQQKSLSEAKTSRDKRIYKESVQRLENEIKEHVEYWYSAKQLSEDVYQEPIKAYVVSVRYSGKNAFGQRLESTDYYNVVQTKSTVKKTDGSIATVYDYEIHESDMLCSPIAKNDCKWI